MAIDLSGMFRNLGGATEALSESVKGSPIPTDPLQRNAMQRMGVTNPLLQQFGQGLGSTMGMDMRSTADQAKGVFGEAIKGDYKQQLAAASQLMNMGMMEQGTALFKIAETNRAEAEAKLKEQRARESLASQLTAVGLDNLATNVSEGGDLDEASRALRERQMVIAQNKGNKRARAAMARNMGDEELALMVERDELNTTTDDMFAKMLSGEGADIKAYTDATGKPVSVPTRGMNVLDESTGKWVTPSTLGLTPAVHLQKTFDTANQLTEKLANKGVERFDQLAQGADQANIALATTARVRELLDKGIFTSFGATLKSDLVSFAVALGLPEETALAQDMQRTQEFVATQINQLSAVLKQYGTGSSITDRDVENAMKQIAADPNNSEAAIRMVLQYLEERAYKAKNDFNSVYDQLAEDGVDQTVLTLYGSARAAPTAFERTPQPTRAQQQRTAPAQDNANLSPSSVRYLQQIGVIE